MKRVLICICAMMTVVIAMAEDVTPAEALKQATQFVQNRIASGQHSRRAAGTPAQLTQTGKVSGLYVFNVDNNGGFVIVSNDDRTEPVLGYSDSGSFDPANMPENMRAWLQGYADEIAWLKEHPDAAVSTSRRTGESESNIKTPIKPLVQTKWNQGTPYNNLCPYYETGKRSVTGCVATAMAQVMNYHQWPQEKMKKDIPGYTKDYSGSTCVSVATLTKTTFDWANMLHDYRSVNYDEDQATAVATLMHYCGASVKMNYGKSSGSNTNMVANALVEYFDYSKSTVTFVSRSFYTYANWIELMYHELSQGRPVVYGGSSTGGGHEFVCDGYQGEDYFHINWGWGGMSDNYFKLSALDPDAQGIGGSSSTDGFHYGQDAVIGIQKNGGTGTLSDITQNAPNLTCNGFTLSSNTISEGESVTITMRITNNAAVEYDGDLYCGYKSGSSYYLLEGNNFYIPANSTKDCAITVSPSQGIYSLVFFVPNSHGSYSTDGKVHTTLSVTSGDGGTTTDNIELERLLVVENSEVTNDNHYNVYGKNFNAKLTVINPNTTYDFKGVYQYTLFKNYEFSSPLISIAQEIRVPSNGSIDIPIKYNDMDYGSVYELDVLYKKNGSWTSWDEVGYYTAAPGITAYHADGTESVTGVSTSYAASEGTLAVDLTGVGVTNVTSSEPNCLFIIGSSDSAPSGANNIIVKNSNGYSATNITLTDNKDFYSPVDFTAANITFNYDFTVAADGEDEYGRGHGWNTLMLPFNVTKVTATDKTTHEKKDIDWFHSSDDTGKNFWVKKFTGDAVNTVNFDFTDKMEANTPYIVAFPGNKWGKKWDMSNKYLKFIGEDVAVSKGGTVSSVTGANYRFIGNTIQDNTENIYSINSDGSAFDINESNGSAPFRAYIKPGTFDRSVMSLAIGSEPEGTTGIEDVNLNVNKNENGNFFNLNGQRVTRPTKGLYISNGKKVIIK